MQKMRVLRGGTKLYLDIITLYILEVVTDVQRCAPLAIYFPKIVASSLSSPSCPITLKTKILKFFQTPVTVYSVTSQNI
jgi:hypothetical protein